MPSADFCASIPSPHGGGSSCLRAVALRRASVAETQTSPGNAHRPSHLSPPHLRRSLPYRYRTLKIYDSSSGSYASYAVSVRRGSALPAASFRPRLPAFAAEACFGGVGRGGSPCRPANCSPCRASRGLAPPSRCALPGAHKKGPHACSGKRAARMMRQENRRLPTLAACDHYHRRDGLNFRVRNGNGCGPAAMGRRNTLSDRTTRMALTEFVSFVTFELNSGKRHITFLPYHRRSEMRSSRSAD